MSLLVGELTRLRTWTAADAAAVHLACQDSAIQRWTRVPSPYTEQDAEDFIRHRVPEVLACGGAPFCVEPVHGGRLVGSMSLVRWDDGVGVIGYWTAPWARGRGLTVDALRVLCRWCFTRRSAARLELHIEPGNAASRAVADRAGFAAEGVLRRRILLDGHRRDVTMYALLAPEDDERHPRHPASGDAR